MKWRSITAALALLSGAAANTQPADNVVDRLGVDQALRLSTLSPARISEMHCAALGRWLAVNRPRAAKSPTPAVADRLAAEVQAAIANDAELPADLAGELITSVAVDAGKKAVDDKAAFAADVESCTPLFAAAASSAPLKLHPLATPSVVSPALASCYAQYRLAASLSEGANAAELNVDADRARDLALKGKDASAGAAAEAVLEAEFQATKSLQKTGQEAGMMRLIMCQPVMALAAKQVAP